MFSRLAAFVILATSFVSSSSVPNGFVTAKDSTFQLNGKPFFFAGTNSYWAQYTTNLADTAAIFARANQVGNNVIRTWGFNDANVTFVPGGLPNYSQSNSLPGQIVFQWFENGKATVNTGATGLQHMDKFVALAEQHNIKLIVTLTNNWADFGGMDVYTINLGGKFHDDFYTNPKIVATFKNYVKAMVTRYKNSPAIFAWELANEPRCGADATRNLPQSPSGCTTTTLTSWANDISTFIKSLDRNHLVTLGDEGWFNEANTTDFAYDGSNGIDFVANLKLENLDFGTFHLYPDWWSKTVDWATQYVEDHLTAMRNAKKPVLMEEYGWMTPEERLSALGLVNNITRVEAVGTWQKAAVAGKMSGDMYWQFGMATGLSTGTSTNDGFTIYLENRTESVPLIFDHVKAVNALNVKHS